MVLAGGGLPAQQQSAQQDDKRREAVVHSARSCGCPAEPGRGMGGALVITDNYGRVNKAWKGLPLCGGRSLWT